jgi:hypothetical protein
MKDQEKDWNPADWQGRSKRQVEDNNLLGGIGIIATLIFVVGLVVYNIIKNGV